MAGVGIYGVAAHAVAATRREIGIRMALGARAGRVVADVLGSVMSATAVGALAGILGAVALVRLLDTFLFGVTPMDPLAFAWALAALGATALLAAVLPARWAARVDPAETMRTE
jgi:ABC-type antimicrobial peptide transport system permease subunit